MSSTQFWVGALVPPFIKWASPVLKKIFKLSEFDDQTKVRVFAKSYPIYFGFLYTLWGISLILGGLAVLILMMVYGPTILPDKNYAVLVLLGLINMIGAFWILGAILDFLFWQVSPENFRDYIIFRQIKSGWGYDIKQQILTLLKIGFIYYLIALPLMALLWFLF